MNIGTKVRIAVWGQAKSGKSTFIQRMCDAAQSCMCHVSSHFSATLNRQIHVEWLEIPELNQEQTTKFLMNTCHGVIVLVEMLDTNDFIMSHFKRLIQVFNPITSNSLSYSDGKDHLINHFPQLFISTKCRQSDIDKYALVHNKTLVQVDLDHPDQMFYDAVHNYLEEVVLCVFGNEVHTNSGVPQRIYKQRLELRTENGNVRSIPDRQ